MIAFIRSEFTVGKGGMNQRWINYDVFTIGGGDMVSLLKGWFSRRPM